jgi:hypothetical protein
MLIRYASLPFRLSCCILPLVAVACGTNPLPLPPSDLPGKLQGSQSFFVEQAVMSPESPCGSSTVPGGGFAAVQILLFESNADAARVCSKDGGGPGKNVGRILDLEIATPQYAAKTAPLTDSLTPGNYAVGNEHQDDPDLCMLPTGTTAFLQLIGYESASPTSISTSGTVSITSVTDAEVQGTFDVTMGGPYGQTDGGTPQLSGSFYATPCP